MGKNQYALFSLFFILGACVTAKKENLSENIKESSSSQSVSLPIQFSLSSVEVIDGSVLWVNVKTESGVKASDLIGKFETTEFKFYPMKGDLQYQALLGIPFNHKPGQAEVKIQYQLGDVRTNLSLPFTIKDGNYPSEEIKVSTKHVHPNKKDSERIKNENSEIAKIYQHSQSEKFWEGPFHLPLQSQPTSYYGTKRVYNGDLQSFHSGLDLKAAEGTPVSAAASGKVVFAKNLFLTGNTVLIDHGFGVFTVYAHLSKIKVKRGRKILVGNLLGLSGHTGRVNGPHLHWGVVIHRVKVNPLEMTKS